MPYYIDRPAGTFVDTYRDSVHLDLPAGVYRCGASTIPVDHNIYTLT